MDDFNWSTVLIICFFVGCLHACSDDDASQKISALQDQVDDLRGQVYDLTDRVEDMENRS